MSKLTGKVAVVTGASKGIGAEIARTLGAAGAAVVVNYASDKAGAQKAADAIISRGGKAIIVQGDVAKAGDVKRLFAETKEAFGGLDILVNNAGVYSFAPLEAVSEDEFHRQFNINVLGLLLTTQEAAKYFGPQGASVINIGSVVTELALPGSAVYTATKGAVDSITSVLAKELGPRKVRVNVIKPGAIETEGLQAVGFLDGEGADQIIAQTPLGRIGQPHDIATIALFLASDDSGWMTGERLIASGGLH